MRSLRLLVAGLLTVGLSLVTVNMSRADMMQAIVADVHHGGPPPPAYTGPGDIVGSAAGWWGLRGYNAAYSTGSNPAIDYSCTGGSPSTGTINILSTGSLDVATLSAACGANAVLVTKMYDQTGNGHHATPKVGTLNPRIKFSCAGSLPCFDTTSNTTGQSCMQTNSMPGASLPITWSAISNRQAVNGYDGVMANSVDGASFIYLNSANAGLNLYNGGFGPTFAINDAVYAKSVLVWNGGSSTMYVNSGSSSGSVGGGSGAAGIMNLMASQAGNGCSVFNSDDYAGYSFEFGVWYSGFTGTQAANIIANQGTYWGI